METRLQIFLVASIWGSAAFAQSPPVHPELIGTWATSTIDCQRQGPSTLAITPSTVLRYDSSGSIIGARIIGRQSVEVQFEYLGPDKRNLGNRIFRLSTDGKSLYELSGGAIVATRRKCGSTNK